MPRLPPSLTFILLLQGFKGGLNQTPFGFIGIETSSLHPSSSCPKPPLRVVFLCSCYFLFHLLFFPSCFDLNFHFSFIFFFICIFLLLFIVFLQFFVFSCPNIFSCCNFFTFSMFFSSTLFFVLSFVSHFSVHYRFFHRFDWFVSIFSSPFSSPVSVCLSPPRGLQECMYHSKKKESNLNKCWACFPVFGLPFSFCLILLCSFLCHFFI